jgi:uncharacterized membrane protein YphA (DoxX/SURF4 family)
MEILVSSYCGFALGFIFLYHAYPKLSRAKSMAGMFGGRVWAVQLLGAVELLGAIGVMTGVYFLVSTCALAVLMVGAMYMKVVKWKVPFSAMDKMGWEFDLILLAVAVALHLGGGGSLFFLM